MHLIIGLGNPGSGYAANRHNIGFMAVDAIHARHGFTPWRSRFSSQVSEGRIGEHKVLLAKPSTFMNLSGQAAGEITRFHKLEAQDMTVIHDELDLEPARTRIKRGGGHGGHNGLKSLDAHIGKDYRRIRLGIGHPGHKDQVSAYVLHDFAREEQPWVHALCKELATSIDLALDGRDSDLNARLNAATAAWRDDKPQGETKAEAKPKAQAKPPAPTANASPSKASTTKGQSHIRQARQAPINLPGSGPMAAMLKKLLGTQDT